MKKYLILLIIPLLFSISCRRDCSCGDRIDSGIEFVFPNDSPTGESYQLYYLVVENHCTENIDTFYVEDTETLNYFEREKIYCEGSW